jgi:hypothetical protein
MATQISFQCHNGRPANPPNVSAIIYAFLHADVSLPFISEPRLAAP